MHYVLNVRAMGAAATLALGMAISIITSTVVASRAYSSRAAQTARSQQEITVKGSARMRIVSDLAVWSIEVINWSARLKDAYSGLEFGVDRLHAFLLEQGFVDEEITVGPIDTTTHQSRDKDGRETQHISGYTLRRSLTVTSADVRRVAKTAGGVTRLLNDGIHVRSEPPQFTYSKVADLKVEILGLASKDARSRANQVASNAGCRIGDVRRAVMGIIQITKPHSTEVSGYGIYDTSTIEKDVSVVVTATFGVEPP